MAADLTEERIQEIVEKLFEIERKRIAESIANVPVPTEMIDTGEEFVHSPDVKFQMFRRALAQAIMKVK